MQCLICEHKLSIFDVNFKNSITSDNRPIKKDVSYCYCNNCGSITMNVNNIIDLEKHYKDDYNFLLENEDTEPELDGIKYSEYIVGLFDEYLSNDKTKSLLDIGSGKGNLIHAFNKSYENIQYHAIEPNYNAYQELIKKDYVKGYRSFFNKNLFTNGEIFNYITLIEVLEHILNPLNFLKEIAKVMNKESLLFIEVPLFNNHKSDLLTIDHINMFTEKNIKNLFQLAGFEIIKENITNRVPMQFIIKLSNNTEIINLLKEDPLCILSQSQEYIDKVLKDISNAKDDKLSVYGKNVVIDYLLDNGFIDIKNIICMINDNPAYQGKNKWRNTIDVVSLDEFISKQYSKNIFLSMNDVYHNKVKSKLDDFNLLGLFI